MTLTGRQRRQLRARAHALDPVVHVGEAGLTDGVRDEIDRALEAHELIKVRMHAPEDKRALAAELASAVGAESCGLVGHTVILWRRSAERPRIDIS